MTRHIPSPMDLTSTKYRHALRAIREEAFPLARDAAARAGFSASYLSEIETGKRTITHGVIKKMAGMLGVSPRELLERIERKAEELPEGEFIEDTRSSRRLHEGAASSRMKMKPPTQSDPLLRHLVSQLTRDQKFTLLGEFTDEAAKGDLEALVKARTLIDLMLIEHGPVSPPGG